ncbi:response regulator transcription factor [bacterium]|nr:MAG: response regulator transcription factor [bacterium]
MSGILRTPGSPVGAGFPGDTRVTSRPWPPRPAAAILSAGNSPMTRPSVLVVDDDEGVRTIVCGRLAGEGYDSLQAADGESALALALERRPDLLIVDVAMPGMGGHELVRRLRQRSSVPVIFLSGRVEDADRIVGLKLGADDYVGKPFSPSELMARVEAVLRRTRGPASGGTPLRLGELELDPERREVRVKGRYVPLAPREFDLLAMLADKKGRVVTRDELVERFWGVEDGAEVSTRTVDQHVARLRRKLTTERRRVLTVKNSGYRLLWD